MTQHTSGPVERPKIFANAALIEALHADIRDLAAINDDLLAALEDAHREMMKAGDAFSQMGLGATTLGMACRKAHAAIAKARGQS